MFLVLIVSFLLLVLCNINEEKNIYAWIKGTVGWCSLLFLHIEVFSSFKILNKTSVFLFWTIVCIFEIIYFVKSKKCVQIRNILFQISCLVKKNKFFTVVIGLIALLALCTVPYNWDSMTYHIPRIVHWIQNQSTEHYATNIIRQIANPPFHEFICLDVYLMSGNRDIFLNLVQCAAFLTNAWLVYEMSRKLGCDKKFSKVGVLLFCSMPVAFAEALTTQNDNLCSMFLMIFLFYLLDFLHISRKIEDCKENYVKVVVMAACVGFGYLTKPTATMAMLFLSIILLVVCIIRRDNLKIITKLILMALPIMLIILIPEMAKNIKTFGAIFPSGTGARQLVGTLNPKYLFINGLKNFSFNLPTIYIINSHVYLTSFVCMVAKLIRVDINDPTISEDGRVFSLHQAPSFGHDTAVSSTILIVAVVCLAWCVYRRKNAEKYPKMYTYVVMTMFALVCIFIRWEPYVSRYMFPYLALMCPMVSVWIEDIAKNAKTDWIRNSSVAVVCWMGILGLIMLFSYHGKIAVQQDISRPEGYFTNRSNIRDEYMTAMNVVEDLGAKNIGLITTGDSYEYPIQYMLKHSTERIEHVLVDNDTSRYEDLLFVPDCILTIKDLGEAIEVHGKTYAKIVSGENINIYTIQ